MGVTMNIPSVKKLGSRWEGQIMAVGGSGNLVTNILSAEALSYGSSAKIWIHLGDASGRPLMIRGVSKIITDMDKHRPMALEGKGGYIEICIKDGSAAETTKLGIGAPVLLEFLT